MLAMGPSVHKKVDMIVVSLYNNGAEESLYCWDLLKWGPRGNTAALSNKAVVITCQLSYCHHY